MTETHTRSFEDFDVVVLINDDGDVSITLRFPEDVPSIRMTWDALREVLDFAAVHGLNMREPYVVEFVDTREAIEA